MNTELAAKLAAHLRFRWMPGMHDSRGWLFVEYRDAGEAAFVIVADDGCEPHPIADAVPDLDDAATVGCLLSMLPDGWIADSGGSAVWVIGSGRSYCAATLGEALAKALLAEWGEG